MNGSRDPQATGATFSAEGTARVFAAAIEAGVAELEARFAPGFGPAERALAARIRAAAARLLSCAEQLAADGLMIRGSTGQSRPHPLLRLEKDLRRELSDGLKELAYRSENRAAYERIREQHRRSRTPSSSDPSGGPDREGRA